MTIVERLLMAVLRFMYWIDADVFVRAHALWVERKRVEGVTLPPHLRLEAFRPPR